jgi:hypothetical protein
MTQALYAHMNNNKKNISQVTSLNKDQQKAGWE